MGRVCRCFLELLKQILLPARQVLRRLDLDLDVKVAGEFQRSTGMPLPRRRNCLPVSVPSGTFTRARPPSMVGTSI